MKKIIFPLLLLLLNTGAAYCNSHGMHPLKQINYVKSQIHAGSEPITTAYHKLIHDADSIMDVSHHALADFAVPGFYVDPDTHRANSLALQQDAYAAYCEALAYRLSGNENYGRKACYFLDAWASINKGYSEHDGVLVMTYSGAGLLIAAELMDGTPLWDADKENTFKQWATTVYRTAANTIRVHKNNWADWGRFGSMLVASLLDDRKEAEENIRLIQSDLFTKITPDGDMPEETRRGDNGIWYSYFSLAPMTGACWIAYNMTGTNLFALSNNGASIKKAIDYVAYYNLHPSEWKWHKNPRTGEHELWPYNLIEAMSGIYNDKNYEEYGQKRRPIVYPIHHFCWTFPTLMPCHLSGWSK